MVHPINEHTHTQKEKMLYIGSGAKVAKYGGTKEIVRCLYQRKKYDWHGKR